MKLHEYQSRDLLARFGVPVPGGRVAVTPEEARAAAESIPGLKVVKAQVLMGGRGKAGGIKLSESAEEIEAFAREIIGKRLVSVQNPKGLVVGKLLVAQAVDIAEEYYAAVLTDRDRQQNVVMLSIRGGMDIEQVAEEDPDAIVKIYIDPAWGLRPFEVRQGLRRAGFPTEVHARMTDLVLKLAKVFVEMDAELVEINPVARTPDGQIVAADAKVVLDDNALYRHPEFQSAADDSAEDDIEAEAARRGIAYVRLDGNVGIIGNGAGLVMCSMDEVKAAGGAPANFLDIGGGAQAEKVKNSVELVLMAPEVKGLLINIFGGITRCDEVARGLLAAFEQLDVDIPVVARIEGTAAEEGRKILEGSRIVPASGMQEAAQKIVALTR
ncbi:MAG: ADP-forming succinate--CoA ligase subunit beta [Fimbriimonadaceae bacterium]